MKRKLLGTFAAVLALALSLSLFAACGEGNPFVGAWDDDENEISLVFRDDGTGVQSDYFSEIAFTYTVEGNTAVITAAESGLSAECRIEDGRLVQGTSTMIRRDAPSYTPENAPSGGRESELSGSYVHESGNYTFTFDGAGGVSFSNLVEQTAGGGTYTFDGSVLVITLALDGDPQEFTGSVTDGEIVISVWGEEGSYTLADAANSE